MDLQETVASSQGIDKMLFNTHPKNSRVINAALKNGYKKISYSFGKDSPWVYMVKWLDGKPYSDMQLDAMYGCVKLVQTAKYHLRRLFKR